MKCDKCQVNYPSELVQPMNTNIDTRYRNVCGICYLELKNKFFGLNDKQLWGEVAEDIRQQAIKFRKDNNIHILTEETPCQTKTIN